MGTDIHMVVETKVYDPDTREDLGWHLVPGPIITCFACNGTALTHVWDRSTPPKRIPTGEPCRWCCCNPDDIPPPDSNDPDGWDERPWYRQRYVEPGKIRTSWYTDRNYVVFAVLGNVRNGRGFGGIYIYDPLPWISDRRGLPSDMGEDTRAAFDAIRGDHSDTWVMLEEVLAYDWNQVVHKTGVLSLGDWAIYRERGLPESWSSDISGPALKYVTPVEMDAYLSRYRTEHGATPTGFGPAAVDGIVPVCRLQWDHPLRDFAANFLTQMHELARVVGEAPTRLVFNFDS